MTTWTDSAKAALEQHLARLRQSLAASGADPAEVADDLRRHVDEEVAARRIGVVTVEDVERILRGLGLPEATSTAQAEGAGAVPGAGRERGEVRGASDQHGPAGEGAASAAAASSVAAPARRRRWHLWLLFFGVVLPALTLGIEMATHMCAGVFFNPIPDWPHGLMVASVPLVNLACWWCVREGRRAPLGLGVASGYALAVSIYYSLLYLPLSPFAVIAVVLFGWGMLPLSPILALFAGWRLRVLLGRIGQDDEPSPGASAWLVAGPGVSWRPVGGLWWGLALGMVAVGATALPPVLTRHWSRMAIMGQPDERAEALTWLRRMGHEQTLLGDCYGVTSWAQGNPFAFYLQGKPVTAEEARVVFYRTTGHAFNEFPPPQLEFGARGWDALDELDWDADQGGTVVGGRQRGLSLAQSRLDGLVDAEAGWAYTEWVMEFRNAASREHEARAQLLLPPGGVVSRVTLWVNGEEREAAFAGSAEVRAAYERVVKVYRRDPILVTHVGGGRVLMQCYPVPANGGTMKVRVGISAPLELADGASAILRWPQIVERNFGVPPALEHSVWLESAQALSASHSGLVQDTGKPGVHALRGRLRDADLESPSALVRIPRTSGRSPAWVPDPHGVEGQWVRQQLVERIAERPGRVVLVVDGSKSMETFLPSIASALNHVPDGVEFGVVVAGDDVEVFDEAMLGARDVRGGIPVGNSPGALKPMDATRRQQLMEWLGRKRAVGGQDNLPALVRAWELAGARPDSLVIWVHQSQPVTFADDETVQQRLLWRRPGAGGVPPRVFDMQVAPGPNRRMDVVGRLAAVTPVARMGTVGEDLQREFSRWSGTAKEWSWTRERLTSTNQPEGERGRKSSKHLARLWAADEVGRLIAAQRREEAVAMAAKYQLVTPVSGAVVLESRQQFEQAGLQPAAPDTVPTVPEPGVVVLLALAGVLAAVRSGWRRWQRASA